MRGRRTKVLMAVTAFVVGSSPMLTGLPEAQAVTVPAGAASTAPISGRAYVFPNPGTPTISTTNQISFRDSSLSAAPVITVTGTSSGAHQGRWVAQSDGGGYTWVPAVAFRPGEQLKVTSSVPANFTAAADGQTWYYTVARPAPADAIEAAAATERADAAQSVVRPGTPVPGDVDSTPPPTPGPLPTYRTEPTLHPPAIATTSTPAADPGLIMATSEALAGYPKGVGPGLMLYDNQGRLRWFDPLAVDASGLEQITYKGQPALAYFQHACGGCIDTGTWEVLSTSYQPLGSILLDGYVDDTHALTTNATGTQALLEGYNPVTTASGQVVLEGVIQEIDLETGVMEFEWHSLGNAPDGSTYVPVADSVVANPAGSTAYDYFHLNSLIYGNNGDLLFSARNTSTIYELDPATGQIAWRLGGTDTRNRLSLTDGDSGTQFEHDVQLRPDGTVSVYDDGDARGVAYTIDAATLTASVSDQWTHSPKRSSTVVGSNRLLANGDQMISYGATAYADEFTPGGQVDFTSQFGPLNAGLFTYRQIRTDSWSPTPATGPKDLITHPTVSTATVSASWNGDTAVAEWRVEAGSSPTSLATVATAAWNGLETTIPVSGLTAGDTTFVVQALDSSGNLLATASDPLQTKYAQLGGASSFLGNPVGGESTAGAGLVQQYQGGNIYWSPSTGAWSVHGVILQHYVQLGGPTGVLGFPVSDEQAAGPSGSGGRKSLFQTGDIFFSPATGAYEVQGVILQHYLALGGAAGFLGFPVSDEQAAGPSGSGGRKSLFQGGDIYFSPGTGAFEVQGAILSTYLSLDGAMSDLGFPTSDEFTPAPNLRQSDFQSGHYLTYSFVTNQVTVH